MSNLLVLSPGAERTGAPIWLCSMMKWLKENSHYNISVLTAKHDELVEEFQSIGPTYFYYDTSTNRRRSIGEQILYGFRRRVLRSPSYCERLLGVLARLKPSIIYANTVVSALWVPKIKHAVRCPVVLHVHELQMAIEQFVGTAALMDAMCYCDHFLAASEATAINLQQRFGVCADKVTTVNSFIGAELTKLDEERTWALKSELGIPQKAKVVLAAGTIDWRKGPDLFIQLAKTVLSRYQAPVIFVWVGGDTTGIEYMRLQYDINMAGLTKAVHFIGFKRDVTRYFSLADLFVLCSREEPMGMVALEAASLGVPVICFNGIGGMPEFVGKDCGVVVPYLDIELMAKAVVALLDDQERRMTLGHNAQQRVRQGYTAQIGAPQIYAVLRDIERNAQKL